MTSPGNFKGCEGKNRVRGMGRNCGDGTVDAVITEGFLVAVTTGQGPEANISGRAPAVQTPEAQCREGARGPGTQQG